MQCVATSKSIAGQPLTATRPRRSTAAARAAVKVIISGILAPHKGWGAGLCSNWG